MKKLMLIAAIAAPAFLSGCYYDNFGEINPVLTDTVCVIPDTVSFSNDIQPIINSTCGVGDNNCHSGNNSTGSGLGNYTDVAASISDETPEKTMKRLRHDTSIDPAKWMPKNAAKLSDCKIDKIQKWIDQGLQNN